MSLCVFTCVFTDRASLIGLRSPTATLAQGGGGRDSGTAIEPSTSVMHTTDLRVLSMVSMMALLSTGSVHIVFDL